MQVSEHERNMQLAERGLGWQRGRRWGNGNGEWIFPATGWHPTRNDWDGTPRFGSDIALTWRLIEGAGVLKRYVLRQREEGSWALGADVYVAPTLPDVVAAAILNPDEQWPA